MALTQKYLAETINLVNNVTAPQDFIVKVGKSTKHSFNERSISLSNKNNKNSFLITTVIKKGVQNNKEIEVGREVQVKLKNEKQNIFTKGKYIIPHNISYPDFLNDSLEKQISGEITSLSTRDFKFYEQDRYYRVLLPLDAKVRFFGDFTGYRLSIDGINQHETLIKILINNNELQLFTYSGANKRFYLVIDSLSKTSLDDFQRKVNAILLAYAFLKGSYLGSEGFILSFKDADFIKPESLLAIILSGGIKNGFPIHTTKPYSLIGIRQKAKYKKDANGNIVGLDNSNLQKYMVEFPSECLSKLCELICNKGGILRAVILFVSNSAVTLEMRIPTLFVALENISRILVGGDTSIPKIIEDKNIEDEIKNIVKASIKEIKKVKTKHKATLKDPNQVKEYDASFARIESKLHGFNSGTNNKKLIEPFLKFGYQLSAEESDIIMMHRNKFLHGSDFMPLDVDYNLEFKELFHMTMRLHTLIAVLLLKASGYAGYILNNAKIYDYISERKLKEKIFIKI